MESTSWPMDQEVMGYFTRWLSHLEHFQKVSPHTLSAYTQDLRSYITFLSDHFGKSVTKNDLEQITASDARSYLAHLKQEGLKSRSLSRKISALRAFYSFLEHHHILKNPVFSLIKLPKLPHLLPKPVSQEGAQRLLSYCEDTQDVPWIEARNIAALLLLYGCGLRISEALQLTRKDISGDTVRVLGKGRKERFVPLLNLVREAIQHYLSLCPWPISPDQPLFLGVKGGCLNPKILQLFLQKARAALHLPDTTTPHAFRHAFASHLLSSGADLRAIQDLLGHASLSSTQGYTEVNRTHLLEQYQKAYKVSS